MLRAILALLLAAPAFAAPALSLSERAEKPVKSCVVIAEPDGAVVTMYPGR